VFGLEQGRKRERPLSRRTRHRQEAVRRREHRLVMAFPIVRIKAVSLRVGFGESTAQGRLRPHETMAWVSAVFVRPEDELRPPKRSTVRRNN